MSTEVYFKDAEELTGKELSSVAFQMGGIDKQVAVLSGTAKDSEYKKRATVCMTEKTFGQLDPSIPITVYDYKIHTIGHLKAYISQPDVNTAFKTNQEMFEIDVMKKPEAIERRARQQELYVDLEAFGEIEA